MAARHRTAICAGAGRSWGRPTGCQNLKTGTDFPNSWTALRTFARPPGASGSSVAGTSQSAQSSMREAEKPTSRSLRCPEA